MKALCVLSVVFGLFGVIYGVTARTVLETPVEPSGGAEIAVVEPEPAKMGEYLFPLHPDDYLMKTAAYGIRVSPTLGVEMAHQGLDIAGVWRAQVVAVADGEVVEHYPPPGTRHPLGGFFRGHDVYGGMVRIRHIDGTESLYAHLASTRIREGQSIRAGEVIGRQGDTGKAQGHHLHFEMIVGGERVNPLLYLPEVR